MAEHNLLGETGEQLARDYLLKKGYEILDENWRFEKAEIDIIAFDGKQLIFVEVKLRTSTYFGDPEEFVDERKQKHLARASEEYIDLMNWEGEIRFDIIAITFSGTEKYTLRHIEDAFFPEE